MNNQINKDELFKLLENLDDNYVAEAGDKLARYYSAKKRNSFPVGTVAMAACAAIFVAVVILFKTNTIMWLPSNSGDVLPSDSNGVSLDLTKEKEFEITLNAAFAYDESGKLKRYEVGDKFGKFTTLKSAAATYLCTESEKRLKKQALTLSHDAHIVFGNIEDSYNKLYDSLSLPSFGDEFLIIYDKPDEENPNEGVIIYERSDIKLTVDYETKTIRFSSGIIIKSNERGSIENESQ